MLNNQKKKSAHERWCTIIQLTCETLKFLWLSVFVAIMVSYIASVAGGNRSSLNTNLTALLSWIQEDPFRRDVFFIGLAALILLTGIAFFVQHRLISSDINKKREEHYKNIEEIFNKSSEQEAKASDLMLQEQQKLSRHEMAAFDQLLQEQQKISTLLTQIFQEQQKHSTSMKVVLSNQNMKISMLTATLQEHSRRIKTLQAQQKVVIFEQGKKREDVLI
jgi:hypothetical protein